MKRTFLLILFLSTTLFAQFKFGEAKGLFMSVGVGPRFPIADFADSRNIGVGFDVTISYTDNEFLPLFFYTSVGYQHNPGSLDFYRRTDYSSFPANILTISPGVRYYFPALLENIVLLMPIVDAGVHFGYIENLHDYKLGSGRQAHIENFSKFGLQVGAGFSMFLLDVITYYNYLPSYQYISFDLRVNIPIFVKI